MKQPFTDDAIGVLCAERPKTMTIVLRSEPAIVDRVFIGRQKRDRSHNPRLFKKGHR